MSAFGTTWKKNSIKAIRPANRPNVVTRIARYLPLMYSPGVSGVAWRSSPTRSSLSRITLMPAPAATKNDMNDAMLTA